MDWKENISFDETTGEINVSGNRMVFVSAGGLKEINVFDLVKHLGDFRPARCNRIHALLEVAGDTRTQIFRFADIKNFARFVFEQIDAR